MHQTHLGGVYAQTSTVSANQCGEIHFAIRHHSDHHTQRTARLAALRDVRTNLAGTSFPRATSVHSSPGKRVMREELLPGQQEH